MSQKLFECEIDYIKENCPIYGVDRVAKAIGRGTAIVRTALKKHGISTPRRGEALNDELPAFDRNYIIFSKRFENITPELSYWIGFFWADGTINSKSQLLMEIVEEDGESLKNLFETIFPFRITKRARRGRKKQMSFSVSDKKIGELLISLGKYPHSSESHEKIMDYLSDEKLKKYFLRGLIDGDGNFYVSKKYGQFTLASNLKQDWSYLKKYLEEFSPFISKEKTGYGTSSVLRITGRNNLIKFITFLDYENIKIGLERKISKAMEILKLYKKENDWKKHVLQFEKDGTFIKEWPSAFEAAKYYGCIRGAITNCCDGYSNTSMGYIWKYKEI